MKITKSIAMVGSGQHGLSSIYDCHVYAVRGKSGVILIDAGSGLAQDAIIANIAVDFNNLPVTAILLTHAHADHAAGAKTLAEHFKCEVIASEATREIMEAGDEERNGLAAARKAGGYPAALKLSPTQIDRSFTHSEHVAVDGIMFEAISVRGHSDDSYCFLRDQNGERSLFSADVVFYGGVLGVINAPDSSMHAYCADINRLKDRTVTQLFPSHGLFTLQDGQKHIDAAIVGCSGGFLPRQIGQGDLIF